MIRLLTLINDLKIYLESHDGIHKTDEIMRECHKQIEKQGGSEVGKELAILLEQIKDIHGFLKNSNYTAAKETYEKVNSEIERIAQINREEFRVKVV